MGKAPRRDFSDILVKQGKINPAEKEEAQSTARRARRQAQGRARPARLRLVQRRHAGDRRREPARLRRPRRDRDSAVGHSDGAGIGRPRERRHAADAHRTGAQGHHARPRRLRDHRQAAVRPQPRDRAGRGAREAIVEAINRYYGQSETESVDSMLQEFTETAIDFTEVDEGAALTGRGGRPGRQAGPPDHPGGGQPCGPATSTSSRSPTASAIRYRIDGV